jgi:hypothetical protein
MMGTRHRTNPGGPESLRLLAVGVPDGCKAHTMANLRRNQHGIGTMLIKSGTSSWLAYFAR